MGTSRAIQLLMLSAIFAGCSSAPVGRMAPAPDAISAFQIGETYKRSMGEEILNEYVGPWRSVYRTTRPLEWDGLNQIPSNTEFVAQYMNMDNKRFLLVNSSFYAGQIAIEASEEGDVAKGNSARQISGAKRWRTWTLKSDPGRHFRRSGYSPDPSLGDPVGWSMQYIGTNGRTLRFTIQELGRDRQRLGQIEYTHDLNVGKEFAFRTKRIRVNSVGSDGAIDYTVIQ